MNSMVKINLRNVCVLPVTTGSSGVAWWGLVQSSVHWEKAEISVGGLLLLPGRCDCPSSGGGHGLFCLFANGGSEFNLKEWLGSPQGSCGLWGIFLQQGDNLNPLSNFPPKYSVPNTALQFFDLVAGCITTSDVCAPLTWQHARTADLLCDISFLSSQWMVMPINPLLTADQQPAVVQTWSISASSALRLLITSLNYLFNSPWTCLFEGTRMPGCKPFTCLMKEGYCSRHAFKMKLRSTL